MDPLPPEVFISNSNPPEMSVTKNKGLPPIVFVLIILVILAIISLVLYYFLKIKQTVPGDKVIVKAGEEEIYKEDFDFEFASYPLNAQIDKKIILDKLINDSVILQSAQKEGLITLDPTVFNSPSKNYLKRIDLIGTAKNKVNEGKESIQGKVISIFVLNGPVGPLGYEKSRQIVFDKITSLQARVKANEITVDQAIEEIKDDSGLEQIDKAYKTNASFNFIREKDEPITRIDKMNEQLRTLKEGEVSDIFAYAYKNSQTKEEFDTYYSFGIVEKVVKNPNLPNFETWLNNGKKNYEISIY